MTTLESLWYGNSSPLEQFLVGNKAYESLLSIIEKEREKLSADFSPEQKDWLDKYDTVLGELNSIAEAEAFKYGFRLAINLFAEITK